MRWKLPVAGFVLVAILGIAGLRSQESRHDESRRATGVADQNSQLGSQKSEIKNPKSKVQNGPSLDGIGYYDKPQLKPGEFTGSIDPGGYSASGHADRSRSLLKGTVRLKQEPGVRSQKSEAGLGDIELALKKAVEAHPQSFETNHQLGEFYIHAGKLTTAIPFLEKAYRLHPSHYVNAYDLAVAYLETRNYRAARNHLQAMIRRQDAAELHDLLAEAEENLGNPVQAAREYEQAAHMEPSEKHIFDWGVELLLHQTFEPAGEVFKSGVERYPNSSKLWIGLGVAHYSRGRYDEAVNAFSRATDLEPSDPRPYLFLAQVYNISGAQTEGVTERLRRFVELQPKNARALYSYALCLWKGKRGQGLPENLAEVESLLKKAAALDPRFPDPHLQLGILYAGRREYPGAIQEYERAIKLKPDLADAHYRLAQACVRVGEKERAKGEFEIYERLHKKQVAEAERERAEIRQFVYTLQEKP